MLDKDKGDIVHWYETVIIDERVSSKKQKIKNSYSTKPQNLNFEEYKRLLWGKLNDTLEIAGFDMKDMRLQLLQHRETMACFFCTDRETNRLAVHNKF